MMSFLYTLLISPIEMLIEFAFMVIYKFFVDAGLSIIFVSIIVQVLVLPLYKKADAVQEREREKQKSMEKWVSHIKKTFKGDKQIMMLSAYYRQNDYKPYYVLKGSISLLLQIPFFMAAYNFLSNLELLNGVSFLFIKDLGSADGLIPFFGYSINLLPILMTVINILSGMIYTKGFTRKEKMQLYLMALVFLVLLYTSPSGLVLYWTMNNLFSLVKNIFNKIIPNSKRVLNWVIALCGVAIAITPMGTASWDAVWLFCIVGFFFLIPLILQYCGGIRKWVTAKSETIELKNNKVFYLSCLLLVAFGGLLIPSSVIKSSPIEFENASNTAFGLIFNTAVLFCGLFLIWLNIFYSFADKKVKYGISAVLFGFVIVAFIHFFFFGTDLGTITAGLTYERIFSYTNKNKLISLALTTFAFFIGFILFAKCRKLISHLLLILVIAVVFLVGFNFIEIRKGIITERKPDTMNQEEFSVSLSKEGKNVIVLMLDRAINGYFPSFIEQIPSLKEMYDGFTYYPNTLTHGWKTNFATPALFGGYEYTPAEMNKRSDEKLEDKHNEALLVMPHIFSDNGYDVKVADPPYAGYSWIPDLSIYEDYENVHAYNTSGKYYKYYEQSLGLNSEDQRWNFFWYSIMKMMPTGIQCMIYDGGTYNKSGYSLDVIFVNEYATLLALPSITEISDDEFNSFFLMQNSSTHQATSKEAYVDIPTINCSVPRITEKVIHASNGDISVDSAWQMGHYRGNLATMMTLGEWFDDLREQGVYDNTRIIIVSDHGQNLAQFDYMLLDSLDIEAFNSLLLVKDFGSRGFETSNEFMTIADVPTLAMDGIIENPENPFTGKKIDSSEKENPQFVTTSANFDIRSNNGSVFDTSDGNWYAVSDDIFKSENWIEVENPVLQ